MNVHMSHTCRITNIKDIVKPFKFLIINCVFWIYSIIITSVNFISRYITGPKTEPWETPLDFPTYFEQLNWTY